MSNIDEILGSIKLGYNGDDDNPVDYYLEKEDYQEAKQQLLAEVLEMIGEDEKIFKEDSIQSTNFKEGANYIKKALRKAAKERFR